MSGNTEYLENSKLNRLRAAVLGANDGIVSTSSLVMGVAGATSDNMAIVIAGLAALSAGALSMAVGEYVSVSSQSDAEKMFIAREKKALRESPEEELKGLAEEYVKQGLSEETAKVVALELTKKDALRAHLLVHSGLDPDDVNSPVQAAVASFLAFAAGGLVPFLVVVLAPVDYRIPATVLSVVVALVVVGQLSGRASAASPTRATVRVVVGGLLAMAITYGIGYLFGVNLD